MNDLRETPSSSGRCHFVKLRKAASNCKLCPGVLPKPMPTSSTTWSAATPHGVQFFQPLAEKFADFPDHVRINRIRLHRLRRALRVHANVTRAQFRHNPPHRIVFAIGRHVVDDAGAGLQCGARDGGLHGVNRKRNFDARHQLFDHRYDAAQFLGFADRLRPGARGFAAEVENFRALRDQFQRVRDGLGRIKKFSAVGKGIGRDVDDAHDERRARKNEFKLSGAENAFMLAADGLISALILSNQS